MAKVFVGGQSVGKQTDAEPKAKILGQLPWSKRPYEQRGYVKLKAATGGAAPGKEAKKAN